MPKLFESQHVTNRTFPFGWSGGQRASGATGYAITSQGDDLWFELRDGDNPTGHGERCELQVSHDPGQVRNGDERWYVWSWYFPEDFPLYNHYDWSIFMQFHMNGPGSPVVSFMQRLNKMALVLKEQSRPGAFESDAAVWALDFNALRGKRTDFVMRVKWSEARDGEIELWVNGVKQQFNGLSPAYPWRSWWGERGTTLVTARTLAPGGNGCYFKMGRYQSAYVTVPFGKDRHAVGKAEIWDTVPNDLGGSEDPTDDDAELLARIAQLEDELADLSAVNDALRAKIDAARAALL